MIEILGSAMNEKETLMELGLTEGKAEIYLAVLNQGDCLVSTIAKVTGAHRTHIYDTLEKLSLKGLVNFSIKENRKYYRVTNPERLLDNLKEKQEKIELLLPSLLQKADASKGEAVVELYKGVQGMKIILRDLLANTKEFFLCGKARFEEVLPKYFVEKIVNEMNRKKIKEFMILEKKQKIIKAKYGKYKYINKKYLFPTAALIFEDKVALFIWKQPIYVILIKDTDISESYKKHFNLLWSFAKEI